MSEFVSGAIIEMGKRKYVILNNIKNENAEYLIVIPVEDSQKKWEEISSIEELKADYDKIMVLAHNKRSDEYIFEKDRDVLTEVFTEFIENIKKGDFIV